MLRNYIITFALLVLYTGISYATTSEVYTVEYAPHSPVKSIPLKNAHLTIAVFYHGIPKGYIDVVTNQNQQFSYDQYEQAGTNLALQVVVVEGEKKHHSHCEGTTTIGNTHQILLVCKRVTKIY